MAPPRQPRSLNKRHSNRNDVSLSNDGDSSKKNMQRKRKYIDMLGPQWSKEELESFYDAYREYNKDWKKVAAAVQNRSVDMVEALYTMNRAYLSLPEGIASVVGLIAMMTDHYCNLVGSDSDQENNEGAGTTRNPQKRARCKVQASKASDLHPSTVASGYDCLALLKSKCSKGDQTRVVGKRTPRFPVSRSNENFKAKKYFSPSRQDLKINLDAHDDEVAREIALALAEASHRGGSPQVSQTPIHGTDSALSSPAWTTESNHANLEIANAKVLSSEMDREGSMEVDTRELSSCRNYLMEPGSVGKTMQKGRRLNEKKLKAGESGDYNFHDIKEVCSGTEDHRLGAVRKKHEMEILNEKVSKTCSQGFRKRSKKVLFQRDEGSTFDALQTLAELSLMMPATENDDDQVKDENNHNGESESLEAIPKNLPRDNCGSSGVKSKWSRRISGIVVASSKASKHVKVSCGAIASPETTEVRKTPKKLVSKMQTSEACPSNYLSESQEYETKEAPKKLINKGKRSSQNATPKITKNKKHSVSADPGINGSDSAQSIAEIPAPDGATLCTKVRSRRKIELKKPQKQKDLMLPDKILDDNNDRPSASVHDNVSNLKKRLSNCLSDDHVRKWCMFEWFYSAIDYPWFAKKEFVEYLHHVGLGHVPRLTRVEWSVIRSSLGKPRRFSVQFLKEEKEKLNQYRESVRRHYTELCEGTREGLPTDLARPLSVGQRVIAIHPKTMEIHDGSVLTVDHSRCRIQFDLPDLGVEFVKDIDCMPQNPYENMPTLLARHIDALDLSFENTPKHKVKAQSNESMKFSSGVLENGDGFLNLSPMNFAINNLLTQTKVTTSSADWQSNIGTMEPATAYSQPSKMAQHQAKEADVRALAELMHALDKKHAVIAELRHMNDDVMEDQKSSDCTLMDLEPFRKQYATIVLQLKEVNKQVSSALFHLRQRNTYQDNLSPRPVANFCDPGDMLNTYDHYTGQAQEPGSHVNETIESSKIKARIMVDSVLQEFNGMESTTENVAPDSTLNRPVNGNEADIPSELISRCVATFLMIQKCTEREFPPAGVAKILDSAVASLQPRCSQNLPVYTEIQKCIGVIKNQILALVPT
ncbi:PREDICTED: protein ALWAYS EARLY 3-like isoform X2 [Ipomoea nil]|uniref:protein ALWAYS EARLY 3-like isoform X2 n=1 Tax=Ipomoea nil TaxID=35883 RepID=UPI000900E73E|nr:PREDICTED: protein ALWAYS EARLY 3-like isoform X2 [Ipomoea nil]